MLLCAVPSIKQGISGKPASIEDAIASCAFLFSFCGVCNSVCASFVIPLTLIRRYSFRWMKLDVRKVTHQIRHVLALVCSQHLAQCISREQNGAENWKLKLKH